jgi:hypothetical protein
MHLRVLSILKTGLLDNSCNLETLVIEGLKIRVWQCNTLELRRHNNLKQLVQMKNDKQFKENL